MSDLLMDDPLRLCEDDFVERSLNENTVILVDCYDPGELLPAYNVLNDMNIELAGSGLCTDGVVFEFQPNDIDFFMFVMKYAGPMRFTRSVH